LKKDWQLKETMMGGSNLDIAKRCEASTCPDWKLDGLIAEAVGSIVTDEWGLSGTFQRGRGYVAKPYTASVDCALELVPEHFHAQIQGVNDAWFAMVNSAAINSGVAASANARTPALALCAAALRVRANNLDGDAL
jgi:hypothetical protein